MKSMAGSTLMAPQGRRFLGATVMGLAMLLVPALAATRPAAAHPLGNFTVNRYARVEVGAGRVRVRYVVDMAEIPTLQEKNDIIDRNRDGTVSDAEKNLYLAKKVAELRGGVHIVLNGAGIDLSGESQTLSFPAGQAGLDTLRLEAWFTAPLAAGAARSVGSIDVRDDNFNERLGWKELLLRAVGGVTLTGANPPTGDISNELLSYPQDALSSPADRRTVTSSFSVDAAVEQAAAAAFRAAGAIPRSLSVPRSQSGFTNLITVQQITLPVLLLSLLAAMMFGGLHAMGPGHGKTVVAAYLVGARGTAKHAIFLGLTVTTTHTIGVFALGFVTLYLSQYIVPDRLYPWLSLISGLIIAAMGLALLAARIRTARRRGGAHRTLVAHSHGEDGDGRNDHQHDAVDHTRGGDGHSHGFGRHHHIHTVPGADAARVSWRSLLGLGISGGILPCPSALVVLLSAISLHRVGFGMLLIVAFSFGLAGVLTGFGLLLVHAGRVFHWLKLDGRVSRLLPMGSALVVFGAGILIAAQTLPQAGTVHP